MYSNSGGDTKTTQSPAKEKIKFNYDGVRGGGGVEDVVHLRGQLRTEGATAGRATAAAIDSLLQCQALGHRRQGLIDVHHAVQVVVHGVAG
ncbi:hypothetical protein TYRP_016674 [Tyrophagus putrescentiae]|nr:hypothetical protein TYRP_016674 [Tyrophagus putrescentiae]